jgi:ABC-2 type transport system ATP-binding protein
MTGAVLSVDGLVKHYGGLRAVDGVSFTARPGEVFGILGPNGAGKSTTLRIIVGILNASAGVVSLDGAPVDRKALRRVGYLPEERGAYRAMTPMSFIIYVARLKGLTFKQARAAAGRLLEQQQLSGYGDRKIKTLSKGMAQKVQIAATIAHDPDLVILDEPFSGLDPLNQASVETMIRDFAARGATVLFSTHIMEHAERMCSRIALIAQGRKAFEGTVDEALAAAGRAALIETEGGFDLAGALAPAGIVVEALTEGLPGVRRWRVELPPGQSPRAVLQASVAVGAPLTAFEPTRATLHDAFVRLVGDAAAPQAPQPQTQGWRRPDA